jgi:hypothetical protein
MFSMQITHLDWYHNPPIPGLDIGNLNIIMLFIL